MFNSGVKPFLCRCLKSIIFQWGEAAVGFCSGGLISTDINYAIQLELCTIIMLLLYLIRSHEVVHKMFHSQCVILKKGILGELFTASVITPSKYWTLVCEMLLRASHFIYCMMSLYCSSFKGYSVCSWSKNVLISTFLFSSLVVLRFTEPQLQRQCYICWFVPSPQRHFGLGFLYLLVSDLVLFCFW